MSVERAMFDPEFVREVHAESEDVQRWLAQEMLEFNESEMAHREVLGRKGKAGTVWASNAKFFGREACVKTIHDPTASVNDLQAEYRMLQRFSQTGFPVPKPIGYVQGNGKTESQYGLLAMERIHAETLDDWAAGLHRRGETITVEQFQAIQDALGSLIKHMHQASLYHRDLHPRNVLIDQDHRVTLIDFGDAKEALGGESDAEIYRSQRVIRGKMEPVTHQRDEGILSEFAKLVGVHNVVARPIQLDTTKRP